MGRAPGARGAAAAHAGGRHHRGGRGGAAAARGDRFGVAQHDAAVEDHVEGAAVVELDLVGARGFGTNLVLRAVSVRGALVSALGVEAADLETGAVAVLPATFRRFVG